MLRTASAHLPQIAVVTRRPVDGEAHQYLRIDPAGATSWTSDPNHASAFCSMREATRMAFRLPAALRAFGMPLETERCALRVLH